MLNHKWEMVMVIKPVELKVFLLLNLLITSHGIDKIQIAVFLVYSPTID